MDQPTEINEAENPVQDKPMPEAQEPEPGQVQEPEQTPVETETTDLTNESPEAPKDNAAWAAMRVENKKLKDALEQSGVDADYLDRLEQATTPQPYTPPQPKVVTEDTEMPQVTGAINDTQRQLIQTQQDLVSLKNQIRESEDREAEMLYPQLKTDKAFAQLVSEKRLTSEVLGKHRRTAEICAEVERILGRRDEQVKAQTRQETEKQLMEKQRVTAEAQTVTSAGKSSVDDEALRLRARKGDIDAQTDLAKNLIAGMDF